MCLKLFYLLLVFITIHKINFHQIKYLFVISDIQIQPVKIKFGLNGSKFNSKRISIETLASGFNHLIQHDSCSCDWSNTGIPKPRKSLRYSTFNEPQRTSPDTASNAIAGGGWGGGGS